MRSRPEKIDYCAPHSVEPFRDNLFGSNHLATPAKSSLHPHHDAPILLRKIRRLVTDHAMNRAVHALLRFDFFDVETMENFHERMNGVLQVITPLRDTITLALRRGSQLLGEPAEVVKKKNEIVNERLLERFVQEIVPIFQELLVQRIVQALIHPFAGANGRELFVNFLEMFREIDRLAQWNHCCELFDLFGKRGLDGLDMSVQRPKFPGQLPVLWKTLSLLRFVRRDCLFGLRAELLHRRCKFVRRFCSLSHALFPSRRTPESPPLSRRYRAGALRSRSSNPDRAPSWT